jgi:hypothetical protein
VWQALAELSRLRLIIDDQVMSRIPYDTEQVWPRTLEALQDPDASLLLELLCGDLDPALWYVQETLAERVWPGLSRTAVGWHPSISALAM